ncbi:ankyrin repeat-containing domain protein [Mycena capillaripes]|nr:ankyrin repeat-containing domain protein [Mycena capillaripes]
MASIAFAFGSFGDILETINLIAKIVQLIRGGGSSSREWAETEKELQYLCSELTHLTTLQAADSLPQLLADRLDQEGALCRSTTSNFHSKIAASRGFCQKVWWATSEEKELAAFRRQLIERRLALSGVVQQINLTEVSRVQDGVDKLRLGNGQIHDSVGSVRQQLTDQERTLSGALIDVQSRVDDVEEQVRRGNDRIQDGVSGVNRQLTAQERTLKQSQKIELEEKLRKWLEFPPVMAGKQHETQKLHHEGTGGWFLDGPEFKEWMDKPGFLWIQGQSGTGKTVLSSTLIRQLFEDRKRIMHGMAVAYFYFDFRDKQQQRTEMMLRSIILQLSAQSPHPYAALDRQYEESNGQTLPTYRNLMDILETLLSEIGSTYIVLDALDECKDTGLLIQFIARLRGWTKSRSHVLFTSQPREIFTAAFEDVPQVTLEFDTTLSDIRLFVSNELQTNLDLAHLARRAEEVKTKVVEKSNGMFRLAACLLDELSRQKLDPDLHTILANLPGDLFGVYSRFLEPIHPKDFIHVARVLRWLLHAFRPMTLWELEDALAFDFSDPEKFVFDPTKRNEQADRVCELLQGFVIIGELSAEDGSTDNDSDEWSAEDDENYHSPVVTLAHSSVADYLVSDEFYERHNHDLESPPSDTFLAQTCIGYLLHLANVQAHASDYPLSAYAKQYWTDHFLYCDDRAVLVTSTMHLLKSGHAHIKYSSRAFWYPRLLCCAEIGFIEGVQFLLENGADVNATGAKYGSALQAASLMGQTGTARFLLEHGADVTLVPPLWSNTWSQPESGENEAENGQDESITENNAASDASVEKDTWSEADSDASNEVKSDAFPLRRFKPTMDTFLSPLQLASGEGHIEIVSLLLDNGAEVNTVDRFNDSALLIASARGHTDIVRSLLENGAEVSAQGGHYGTALVAASLGGHTDTVRSLLENGAEVNAERGDWSTALVAASVQGHADIVRSLLENGAEANVESDYYGTALVAASKAVGGHAEIVRSLLENGADVNAEAKFVGTALMVASGKGHTDIVHSLLENGAEVNAQGGTYGSALVAASSGGYTDIVRSLLENGAEVNTEGGYHGSALPVASKEGHLDTVRLLLENGAEVNAKGKYGSSALLAASVQGHADIVRSLLENGAEVNAEDKHYGTALVAASVRDQTDIVRLLLENGAEVNAEDRHGDTALMATSANGHTNIVRLLLENGAEVNAQGGTYGSALMAASEDGHMGIVRSLLENGAKVNAEGGKYGTALVAASARGHTDIVSFLLENGAEVNAEDGKHGTALVAASARGHTDIVLFLLENGAEVNAEGGSHSDALGAASAAGHTGIVRLLLENGADVNAEGEYYGTALMVASARGYMDIVRLLLENGAGVNAEGDYYGSALAAASARGHTDIVGLLMENGAQVSAPLREPPLQVEGPRTSWGSSSSMSL